MSDLTSHIFGEEEQGRIEFIAKENGIFCGSEIIRSGYQVLDQEMKIELKRFRWRPSGKGANPCDRKGSCSFLVKR